ncbi:MAG: hypothetical protein A6F70_04585 [Cycloclasticus sp. symbiont of Bathymodiolus heckerae]|nr:MAG: hypothetical protein A6F70_04585 [Cycloclasticus sp. symbiont of Bathymodiolus heckerae]
MTINQYLSAFAIGLTFYGFYPYIRSILNSTVKPHVFSWVIWGSTTLIVFFAQLKAGGGVGAWPIGVSAIITCYVAYLAYTKKGDIHIKRIDWVFFILALSSLPLWYLTADPLWAVIILTMVDILGLLPTMRKAYEKPYEESIPFFVIIAVRNTIAVVALEVYSVTTILFPATVAVFCLLLIMIIGYRRRVISKID